MQHSTYLKLVASGVVLSEVLYRYEASRETVDEKVHHLAYELIEGKHEHSPTLVFLHGWPDDPRIWTPFARKANMEYGYRCVNIALPGYPLPADWSGVEANINGGVRNWGFGFLEAAELIKATIERVNPPGRPAVTILGHDWGSVFGMVVQQRHPELVSRMISVDVGWATEKTATRMMFILAYQGWLNHAWIAPTPIGTVLTKALVLVMRRTPAVGGADVHASMDWPYRAAWRDVASSQSVLRALNHAKPKLPWLYVYGRDKPKAIMFHDEAFLQRVKNSSPKSRVESSPGDHWLITAHFDKFYKQAMEFLRDTEDNGQARL